MQKTSTPGGGRRIPSWRLAVLSLSAVVLAIAGTTVALQSANAEQPTAAATTTETTAKSTTSSSATAEAAAEKTTATKATTAAATTTAAKATTSSSAETTVTTAATTCTRTASATAKTRISNIKLPNKVKGYGGEGDTEVLPMAIASAPNGRSWLAWVSTNDRVYLQQLSCADKLIGKATSFAGIDLQDVSADAKGGVLLITKKGSCGTGPLCGGESSPCNTIHMIRFNTSGKQVWDQQVTNLTSARKGYTSGARFAWWYQHHGRLAYDGTNYAAYFGTAITVKNGSCVDIHEGDRMQVVNSAGNIVKSKSVDVGCSHAWTSRIIYDPTKKKFVMVCATDNDCRIAQPNPYRTVAASKCDGTLFGGDLVLAGTGYWTAWSQGNAVKISRFTTGAANKTVKPGVATQHPHLVRYSKSKMLLTWGSGAKTKAKVLSRSTGATIGSTLTINVKDHNYMSFKEFKDGSAAYAAAGATTNYIKIARVMPIS
ncbi:hypothetical protein GCM10022223_24020 [Kineosporia mesophila]|uniref:Uncharacterized protein n=1 Tax=Kineosporia mesophila TaxID=566012 RepID=A0ABP6ZHJ3_9ACTN|nr:hypothetical protein [Kineosporia mesophila]MCD5354236.1 hypothetical protein [Kineosporia mesophila]